jgi:hypothetical protein
MNTAIIKALAASALLAAAGCASSGAVTTDYDAEQDFTEYTTFAWTGERPMKVSGIYPVSPEMEQRFMASIKSTLADKGYRYVDEVTDADFAVSFTVGARDEIEILDSAPLIASDNTWVYVSYDTGIYAHNYHEGSLAIDVFDADRRVLVWHSVGEKRLSDKELQANGDPSKAVDQILADFPSK